MPAELPPARPEPAPAADAAPALVPGRACGSCSLCCKVMEVREFAKPKGSWCAHCVPGQGCAIYAARPPVCRGFHCAWLTDAALPAAWRPAGCAMVVVTEDDGRRRIAHVDPDDPGAWRREPWYGDLKRWARAGMQVAVYVGRRVTVVLPDRDTELGLVGDDEMIAVQAEVTPFGRRLRAFKTRRPPGGVAQPPARAAR